MGGSSQKTDDATGGDVLDKTKNPPKPRVSTDVEDLVKKYSKQQSQELKKEFKKNQDELSKALTAQVATSVSAAIQALGGQFAYQNVTANQNVNAVEAKNKTTIENQSLLDNALDSEDDVEYFNDQDEEEQEDDDICLVDEIDSKAVKQRVAPSDETVSAWARARKVSSDYSMDEWTKFVKIPSVTKYTSHPGAKSFKAPAVDGEVPQLKYKEQKIAEKRAEAVQTMVGAVAHLAAENLVDADIEVTRLTKTISEFEDSEVEIKDPRKEAAQVLSVIRDQFVVKYGKANGMAVKILGAIFNEMSKSRRAPYLQNITLVKNTRSIVKRLPPSDSYLFGGKLAEVSKNLKDAAQLNPLASSRGRGISKGAYMQRSSYDGKRGYLRKGGASQTTSYRNLGKRSDRASKRGK